MTRSTGGGRKGIVTSSREDRSLSVRLIVIAKSPPAGALEDAAAARPATPEQAARAGRGRAARHARARSPRPPARARAGALDGPPGDWLPDGFGSSTRARRTLERRLAHVFSRSAGPTLLIGMDTPQVDAAGCSKERSPPCSSPGTDAVLGHAEDGGYWAIGLRRPDPRAFAGVPMSVAETGARQEEALRRLGLRVAPLPTLRDVDLIGDARAVAATAPAGGFARDPRRGGGRAVRELSASRRPRRLRGRPPRRAAPEGAAGLHAVGEDGSRRAPAAGPLAAGRPTRPRRRCWRARRGPVLDIGCGVGRHVVALRAARGAGGRGRDLPGRHRDRPRARRRGDRRLDLRAAATSDWATALLLDGNIGIGGDATRAAAPRRRAAARPAGRSWSSSNRPRAALARPRGCAWRARARSATGSPGHFVGSRGDRGDSPPPPACG